MKNILLILLSILSIHVFGKGINVDQAQKAAIDFFTNQSGSDLKSASMIDLTLLGNVGPQSPFGLKLKSAEITSPEYYIFNVNQNQGFVIVAGDDAAIPVLGYSNSEGMDLNNLPPALIKWMEGYKKQIQYIRANNQEATKEIKEKWANIGKASQLKSTQISVAPLLKTKWDQSPFYNAFCPRKYFWSDRAVTGCVATAMAQILKYHDYPNQGAGIHSYNSDNYGRLSANFGATVYDWVNMPEYLTQNSTSVQKNAIATLMYHCGVSIDMGYGLSGESSGISSLEPVAKALKDYFRFSNTVKFVKRENYSNNIEWVNLLKNELNNKRPIEYAGVGNGGGHAFVFDGYNGDYFHVNWGWSGQSDTYFLIDALEPSTLGVGGGDGGYNSKHQAVIGIMPQMNSDLQIGLYSKITVPTIYQMTAFDIKADIANYGTSGFSGDFCAAIFDSKGSFIDYIETKANQTLAANKYFPAFSFHSDGLALYPGTYSIGLYYKTTDGNWVALLDKSYKNFVEVKVLSPFGDRDLRLYDSIRVEPNLLVQGQPLKVKFDIANMGTSVYQGTLVAALYDIKGNLKEIIDADAAFSLEAGFHFTNGLTFSSNKIVSEPGTYMLALGEVTKGESTAYVVSPNKFLNPLMVNIVVAPLKADPYEYNDTLTNSYKLPVTFIVNTAHIDTDGTNIHNSSDVDYFEIDLPKGYSYTVTPRIHDSNSSTNGLEYDCDVFWAANVGSGWSDIYDDVAPSPIVVKDGGKINFGIMPYFPGEIGTYLFELNINRTLYTSTKEISANKNKILIYPNPTKNEINIESSAQIDYCEIVDVQGRSFLKEKLGSQNARLDIRKLNAGIYFLRISSEGKVETRKIIKQ